ncbi:MAG: endonuclease/exonuclease/phosphatase family protein [Alphaproteobacteria bacterium]|nr:endonuclease/exonuclease/phosphatase family protein [Alphaproteobacteria bacterium]
MIALLLLLIAPLLTVVPAGAAELKLATWNLEWLTARPPGDAALPRDVRPKGEADIALLARYATTLAADVVAMQEVDGPEIAARIFPPSRYVLHMTRDSVVQRVGFAIRRDIRFAANEDLTALDRPAPGQRHLRSGADVTLDLPSGKLRLLAVHLKSGCREEKLTSKTRESCTILRVQHDALTDWVAARRAGGEAFVILGDFNRWMDNGDAFWAGLVRAAPLARATEGTYSPCWGGGGFIDHIIAGGAAREWMMRDTLKVQVYRETGEGWKERLSDHCPVSVRLRLPN